MSRIGKLPISIPDGVTITVDSDAITVKGPKGELKQFTMAGVDVVVENDKVIVKRVSDEWEHRSKHGLMRTLVANMIEGVTKGFEKQLQILAIRAQKLVVKILIEPAAQTSHLLEN